MPLVAFANPLRDVLHAALATDPHRRPASALELKHRLHAAISA